MSAKPSQSPKSSPWPNGILQAQIVIAADVEHERARVIQQRYLTLQLEPGATAQDVIWELSLLDASESHSKN